MHFCILLHRNYDSKSFQSFILVPLYISNVPIRLVYLIFPKYALRLKSYLKLSLTFLLCLTYVSTLLYLFSSEGDLKCVYKISSGETTWGNLWTLAPVKLLYLGKIRKINK